MHILRCLQFFTAAIWVLICYPSSHIWLELGTLTVLTKKCFKKPNGWCKKVFVRIFIRPESFLYLELCVELLNSDVETYNYEIHFYSLNKKQDGVKRPRHGRPCKDNKDISETSRAHILRNIADCITPEPLSPSRSFIQDMEKRKSLIILLSAVVTTLFCQRYLIFILFLLYRTGILMWPL